MKKNTFWLLAAAGAAYWWWMKRAAPGTPAAEAAAVLPGPQGEMDTGLPPEGVKGLSGVRPQISRDWGRPPGVAILLTPQSTFSGPQGDPAVTSQPHGHNLSSGPQGACHAGKVLGFGAGLGG